MLLIQESDSCTTVLQDSILDRLGYISNTFIGQGDTPRVTELQTLYNSWIAVTVATIIVNTRTILIDMHLFQCRVQNRTAVLDFVALRTGSDVMELD